MTAYFQVQFGILGPPGPVNPFQNISIKKIMNNLNTHMPLVNISFFAQYCVSDYYMYMLTWIVILTTNAKHTCKI